jgi:hypothetical protein
MTAFTNLKGQLRAKREDDGWKLKLKKEQTRAGYPDIRHKSNSTGKEQFRTKEKYKNAVPKLMDYARSYGFNWGVPFGH